eukprot:scaffold42833_cov54-Phaeocystis_antarctica.AAC.3
MRRGRPASLGGDDRPEVSRVKVPTAMWPRRPRGARLAPRRVVRGRARRCARWRGTGHGC